MPAPQIMMGAPANMVGHPGNPGCSSCSSCLNGHDWKNDDCGNGGGLTLSVEALYLKPRWDNSSAFTQRIDVFDFATGTLNTVTNSSANFDPKGRISPRITAGFGSSEGVGVRARWFHGTWGDTQTAVDNGGRLIDTGLDSTISTLPALGVGFTSTGTALNPSTMVVSGSLRLDVWDVEGTTNLKFKNVELGFSAGLRYLHASQDYNAVEFNPAPEVLAGGGVLAQPTSQAVFSGHNVNVAGPSAGIEGRIPVGGTGLSLYSLSRGSLLFGEGKQTAVYAAAPQDGTLAPGVATGGALNSGANQVRDTLLPTLEIEFGTEFAREMGNSAVFFKTSLVGMLYYNLGNPARVGNIGDPRINSMALWGVSVGAGVRY